ncbi:MAG: TetR/AcrR family transcriptional regulator [Eubacteriales bacterium]
MVSQEKDIKEKILHATVELIIKHGDTSKITVREIAAGAGVAIGLINYHFQTKDNLISLCTLEIIRHSIEQLGTMNENVKTEPIDQMKTLGRGITEFMVMNPGVSRISITRDFVSADAVDNSVQVVKMFSPIARKICGNDMSDQDLHVLLHMLVSSIEAAFLRKDVMKESFGIDLDNAEQRDHLVDFCIDRLFSK